MTEESQSVTEVISETPPPTKPPPSEARLLALAKARERAMVVRAEKKQLRDKEKEIERLAVQQTKKENSERIQREYEALTTSKKEEEDEVEEEVVYKKAPKKKKRIVVVQEDSEEDEVEVRVQAPKQKQKVKPEVDDQEERAYRLAYNKMFGLI